MGAGLTIRLVIKQPLQTMLTAQGRVNRELYDEGSVVGAQGLFDGQTGDVKFGVGRMGVLLFGKQLMRVVWWSNAQGWL